MELKESKELRLAMHESLDRILDIMLEKSEGRQGIYDLMLRNTSCTVEDELPEGENVTTFIENVMEELCGFADNTWRAESCFYTRKVYNDDYPVQQLIEDVKEEL